MQHGRKKGILYTSSGATRKFQTAGKIQDPMLDNGTNAGNMLRKVSGYGKNLLTNSKTWGDGSRINARRAMKQFDANASIGQKTDMTKAKISGDYGGYFKKQGEDFNKVNTKLDSMAFKPKPSNVLSPSNYDFKDGQITNTQPSAMQAAGNAATQPVVDKGVQAIDAVGAGAQGAAAALKPAAGFQGNAGAYAAAGNLAGSALQSIDDGKDYKYTNAEKAGTVGGSALKTAATGASIGMMFGGGGAAAGAIIGGVVGTIGGFIKKGKKKKEAAKALAVKTTHEANEANTLKMNEMLMQDQNLAASPIATQYTLPATSTFTSRKTGGAFKPIKFDESISPNRIIKYTAPIELSRKKFKRGGSIKPTENIIPAGVLHEEDNELGDKGMPVVKCKNNTCEKKYEIERDEMIFTLSATKQTEELAGKKDYSKLGKFVKAQILDNTHSFTEKYKDLNNM